MVFQVEQPVRGKEQLALPIHEHRQWAPQATENDVTLPNPGLVAGLGLMRLNIIERALRPGPMASFLRDVNTMENPPNPSYLHGGPPPVDDIQDLRKEASVENLVELQRYLERLQFEATCLRLWSNGIQDQIMDETQRVHTYMTRMTEELNRVRRSQPQGWLHQWQARASQPPQLQHRVQHRLRHQLHQQLHVHRQPFSSSLKEARNGQHSKERSLSKRP